MSVEVLQGEAARDGRGRSLAAQEERVPTQLVERRREELSSSQRPQGRQVLRRPTRCNKSGIVDPKQCYSK